MDVLEMGGAGAVRRPFCGRRSPPMLGAAHVLEIESFVRDRQCGIVGESAALQVVLARAQKVAPTESTVLLTGETGTGKEVVARAIHRWSRRANGPFVSVNCAAVPQSLIASELFGHERGSFTGALQRRLGRFELAAGGTLFLDEIGELPAETQVLLLRVLQEREFERVGGATSVRADVRIIAATNRELERAIARGDFRKDLFYRLAVFPLEMPPLRRRASDVPLLVEHFVRRSAAKLRKPIRSFDAVALARLQAYTWPGNVRELENLVERSMILCDSEFLTVDPGWTEGVPAFDEAPLERRLPERHLAERDLPDTSTLDDVQREAILRALDRRNWVVSGPRGAAALLGIKRTTLQYRMQKLGIERLREMSPQR